MRREHASGVTRVNISPIMAHRRRWLAANANFVAEILRLTNGLRDRSLFKAWTA